MLAREHRLLALCAVSALAHLLILGVIARAQLRPPRTLPASALSLTLAPAPASATLAAAPAAPAQRAPAPQVLAVPIRGRPAADQAAATPPAPLQARAPANASNAAPSTSRAGWDVGTTGTDTSAPHSPGFQAAQAPPSARLDYAVTASAGDAAQPPRSLGSASLEWRSGDQGYRLALLGAGVLGELSSTGQPSDVGLVPVQARAADGGVIDFDWDQARVKFAGSLAGSNDSAAISADAQDRASMLMRLAAIGLAAPGQLDAGIELQVAGANGIGTVRFENAGLETIETALGAIECLHLRQQTSAGQARLEIWLAPQRSWYPLRLRLTAADGSVLTQTVTAISPLQ
jgi:hypothetical protein